VTEPAPPIELLRVPPTVEARQREAVRTVRAAREDRAWRDALGEVARSAAAGDNLVPPVIAAVEARATVGEIADVLRSVFGEYREQAL
jgi:methylmalonyl-CoA mutase N-terminal domain/subunit